MLIKAEQRKRWAARYFYSWNNTESVQKRASIRSNVTRMSKRIRITQILGNFQSMRTSTLAVCTRPYFSPFRRVSALRKIRPGDEATERLVCAWCQKCARQLACHGYLTLCWTIGVCMMSEMCKAAGMSWLPDTLLERMVCTRFRKSLRNFVSWCQKMLCVMVSDSPCVSHHNM